jgi:hypothetical protein
MSWVCLVVVLIVFSVLDNIFINRKQYAQWSFLVSFISYQYFVSTKNAQTKKFLLLNYFAIATKVEIVQE